MVKIDRLLSMKISMLSIVWMFAIVLFHSSYWVDAVWYRGLMADCRFGGVGFFFAVSGFFLMRKEGWGRRNARWGLWREAIRVRMRSLGVPYLLWCMVGWAFIQHFDEDALRAFGVVGLAPSANGPLWYVKFLFAFVLASPLVAGLIELFGYWMFALWAGMMLAIPFLPLPLKCSMFFACFVFGCVCARCPIRVPRGRKGLLGALMICFVCVAWFRINRPEVVPLQIYGAFLAGALIWLIVPETLLQRGSASVRTFPTFFIFCSHSLILSKIPNETSVIGAVLVGLCSFLFLAAFAMVLRRMLPGVYGVAAGGR